VLSLALTSVTCIVVRAVIADEPPQAKHVILMIGDGWGARQIEGPRNTRARFRPSGRGDSTGCLPIRKADIRKLAKEGFVARYSRNRERLAHERKLISLFTRQ
jgi:alkaline phosphatase